MEQEHVDQEEAALLHVKSHFDQADEFKDLLARLIRNESDDTVEARYLYHLSIIVSNPWSRFSRPSITPLLDAHQEQSHLLDPHLEQLVVPMVEHLRALIQADSSSQQQDTASLGPSVPIPAKTTAHVHLCFRYLYYLTKTRGYKTVDSQAGRDGEFVVALIFGKISRGPRRQQIPIVRRMIDLCKFYLCSTGKERDGTSVLVARVLTSTSRFKCHLSLAECSNVICFTFVVGCYARRDTAAIYLTEYVAWASEQVQSNADVFMVTGILTSFCAIYQLGPRYMLLPTLDTHILPILRLPLAGTYATNAVIRKLFAKFAQRVGMCYLKPKVASWRYQRGNRSLKQNLEGTTVVDAENVSKAINGEEDEEDEVPEQIEEIVEILLNGLRDKVRSYANFDANASTFDGIPTHVSQFFTPQQDTIVRWSSAKGLGRITQRLHQELADDVIGSLLELFSENTLPTQDSDEPDLSAVSDNTYHGACLAVAELARRGLLLPTRLTEVVPWCVRALRFDQKRGSHSVGAHVRDAACYVCWSFARAYAPEVIAPHVERIANSLVVVSVFDREVNGIFPHGIDIIQAADYFSVGNRVNAFLKVSLHIAKFEEYRYHLIDHLCASTANHWDKTLRNLGAKALHDLTQLDPRYIIEHVLPILVPLATSPDMNTSHGALMAVGEVCMGLYQCRETDANGYWVTRYPETVQNISAIISRLSPSMLTTFGSEHMREATCHLVTCLSQSNWPAGPNDTLASWKAVIHTSLGRKEENVQEHAVRAFGAIARRYGVSGDELRQCVTIVLPSRNVSKFMRRGYALALGVVEYNKMMECASLNGMSVVGKTYHLSSGLVSFLLVNKEDNLINNAEVKRNAILSLTQIVGMFANDFKTGRTSVSKQFVFALKYQLVIPKSTFSKILSALLAGLEDYSTDQRGDVGSWIREASMRALGLLVPLVARLDLLGAAEDAYLSQATCLDVISGLLKQSVERIDRTRVCAGAVLYDVVYAVKNEGKVEINTQWLIEVPGRSVLEEVMPRGQPLNWASPADVYPRMVRILVVPEYRFDLLAGLISSAGGLTESLVCCFNTYIIGTNQLHLFWLFILTTFIATLKVRHSSACLVDYISCLPVIATGATDIDSYPLSLTDIAQTIVSMFTPYQKQDRVTIPLLEVTGLLFETGTLNNVADETM
ncbi:armadillo-type protein [Jimgerdemannia flammicorona]|uniref:Armadillo-type protein n=1 Tax=Jimgerdemannia flammicorona TaxID=994334 RepID=A0A433D2Q9_9FUNG|nr:armadillo-type protein [Jimgerdemannia flammicorona]